MQEFYIRKGGVPKEQNVHGLQYSHRSFALKSLSLTAPSLPPTLVVPEEEKEYYKKSELPVQKSSKISSLDKTTFANLKAINISQLSV